MKKNVNGGISPKIIGNIEDIENKGSLGFLRTGKKMSVKLPTLNLRLPGKFTPIPVCIARVGDNVKVTRCVTDLAEHLCRSMAGELADRERV